VATHAFWARQSRQGPVADMFLPEAHASGLSTQELVRFDEDGWVGNYPLLTRDGIAELFRSRRRGARHFLRKELERHSQDDLIFDRRPWFKSMHAYLPAYCRLALHPAIVARVASILGPDVIAWGVATSTRRPGQRHRWHVDVEHRRWPGVSVFIALRNVARGSSLKVISGSHRVDNPPGPSGLTSDEQVLAACRKSRPASELVTVELREGEFFIFDGRLWHGSHNRTLRTRTALIAQYARPDAEIAIPLNYDEPIRWHSHRPPCILVRGSDRFGINRLVAPPSDG
jgi:Phytanoyl-CoA dioxygenase (PhyH)